MLHTMWTLVNDCVYNSEQCSVVLWSTMLMLYGLLLRCWFIIEVFVAIYGFFPPSCRVLLHRCHFIRRTIFIHLMVVLCLCRWRFHQYSLSCILETSFQILLIMINIESAAVELKAFNVSIVQYWYYKLWVESSRHCELRLWDTIVFMFIFSTYYT